MTRERVAHGRAIISGHLGGAKLDSAIDSLVIALAADIGRPPRSRPDAWPDSIAEALAAVDSIAERNESLAATIRTLEALKRTAQSEATRAKAAERNAKATHAAALESALLFGAEADELRAVLAPLADILAALPMAVLASTGEAGRLAALYLQAEVLAGETPAERYARIGNKLAGEEREAEEESE